MSASIARWAGTPIDYLSFVPDGEPTLDKHLGQATELSQPLGYKIAVITNGSLKPVIMRCFRDRVFT